jgi:hypothetical protein
MVSSVTPHTVSSKDKKGPEPRRTPARCGTSFERRSANPGDIHKLAEEAGVSTETIYSLEHGRREFMWPRTAKKLVEAKDFFS